MIAAQVAPQARWSPELWPLAKDLVLQRGWSPRQCETHVTAPCLQAVASASGAAGASGESAP